MKNRNHVPVLTWLSRTIGKRKQYIVYLVFLQAFLAGAGVCFALLFRRLIDQAAAGNEEGFFRAVLWVLLLMVSQRALNALGYYLYEWTRSTMENQFKERLFSSLLHKSYASVTAVHSGEWMNRLTSDTAVVANGIIEIIPGLTGMMTRMAGALMAIFVLEPMFIVILVPGGIVMLLSTYGFRRILKRLHKQIQEADGAVRVFLQERLGNLMIVRTFAMEKGTQEAAAKKMGRHKEARMRRNHLSNLCSTGFGVAANGLYLFGAAYCGYGILNGEITYGTMAAVLQLIGQIQSPFANLTGILPRYYAMIASAERLMEAEGYEEDCEGETVPQQEIIRFYREEFVSIGLRNAGFAYQPSVKNDASGTDKPAVLKNVSLDIGKGEYIAFTGHSGCGKSTILKLLMSLYPLDFGERYIEGLCDAAKDGCAEGDGSDRAKPGNGNVSGRRRQPLDARWRGLFAYVPQGNQLMSGTIREIVAFEDPEGMRQEPQLARALQIACADEFVNKLEDGVDTLLGERGSGLSEGQLQRIAIARAIFSDHPILMLDESTSALDEATEKRLLANLRAMTDKTVLIVTHRPEVLNICDKQIVMAEDGWKFISSGKVVCV